MAHAVAGHDKICAYICEALGLDSNRTRSIQINMSSNAIVTVTAEIYPDKRELEIIGILLEDYNLVPKGMGEQPTLNQEGL
jgi:hypothetical protein